MTKDRKCNVVAHDHIYCMSLVDKISNCLTLHDDDMLVFLATDPLAQVKIDINRFSIEHVVNNEPTVQFSISFPSYSRFIVNQLTKKTDTQQGTEKKSISMIALAVKTLIDKV